MQPWTREQILRFAPAPRPRDEHDERPGNHAHYIQTFLESWQLLQENGVNTPLRLAHFMAIIGHETGGFTIIREDCRWTYARMCELWPHRFAASDVVARTKHAACRGDEEKLAEMAYGGRADLGNSEPGDGWAYRGGGPFQDTGRARYREAGHAIGVDLEGSPEQIEDPRVAIKAVLWAWKKYKLGELADRNYLRSVQNAVNRGNPHSSKDPIGWEDRQRWFNRAWAVFGDGVLPSPLDLSVGASGPEVVALQRNLRRLGYACGAEDGIFGGECRRAVAAFKADHKANFGEELEPDDIVGAATKAALATAEPIRRPEREMMTLADLKQAGSSEVAAGLNIQRLGPPIMALGLAGGATTETASVPSKVDPTPVLQEAVGWVPQARSLVAPVIDAAQWGVRNWWWVVAICFGVWMYAKGGAICKARLEAARRGLNLWR